MEVPFPLASNPAPFNFQGNPRVVNCYAEQLGPEHRSPIVWQVIPGQKAFSSPTDDQCRGMMYLDEKSSIYSVHQSRLYKINSAGTATEVGGGRLSGVGPVIMARNDATEPQIAVVTESDAYIIENDAITWLDFDTTPNSVASLDGYFIWTFGGGAFQISALNDGKTNDPLDFATAEAQPDGLVRAYADRSELWLFGGKSIEIWTNVGNADFPFARQGGAFIDRGLGAKFSVATFDNAVHWIGDDGVVYRGAGYTPQRVSSHAVERAIREVSDWSTIRGYSYTDAGHVFYVLTCPTFTWAFDQATGLWAERETHKLGHWRAWPYVRAFGKHIVGDTQSGALRELDSDTYTDAGGVIRAELTLPDMTAFPNGLEFDRLDLDCATGVGASPEVMLDWSDDGGATWSNERILTVGATGNYGARVRANRLGTCRNKGRRFRIAMTDGVIRSFLLADVQANAVQR
jgi:hypothetical protein